MQAAYCNLLRLYIWRQIIMCQAKRQKLKATSSQVLWTLRLEVCCIFKKSAQTFTDAQRSRPRDMLLYIPLKPDVSQSTASQKTHLILNVVYVFLLLSMYSYRCLCILNVVHVFLDAATLTEVFPCFFRGCKANARA